MDRREREAIMRQGVSRPETPRDRRERRALEEDLTESPLAGKPVPLRLRNFKQGADAALRALGGPLAWMRRLRSIERGIAEHEERLAAEYELLRDRHAESPAAFASAWQRLAEAWDFSELNDLIDRHNRHFPVEAQLPMSPQTGDFVHVNGRPYTREPLDAEWILRRFPA